MRDGKFDFRAPTPAPRAPGRRRAPAPNPLVLQLGQRPAALPGRGHLGRAGQGGRRSAAGTSRSKKALVGDRPGEDHAARSCRRDSPADLAKTFGDPVLRRHRRPVPHPGRGRRRGRGAGRADRRRVRRVRGRRARQPEAPGRRRDRDRQPRRAVRRQVHRHDLPAPFDPTPATRRTFAVTGRQERSACSGWPPAAAPGRGGWPGVVDRAGQRRAATRRTRAG